MITQSFKPILGGTEMQLEYIAPFLAERGIDVTIITRSHPGAPATEVIPGARVQRVFGRGPKAVASLLWTLLTIGFALRFRRRIDVVHAHGVLSPLTAALGASMLIRKPIVVKVTGSGDFDRLLMLPLGRQRLALAKAHVGGFIAISRAIHEVLEQLDVPPERIFDIPSGVDLQAFKPLGAAEQRELRRRLGLPTDELLGVDVGRFEPVKNLDLLLTAWQHVRQGRLVLVGDGPDRAALEDFADRSGLRSRVVFVGASRVVANYLQAADWFVQPSSMEGLSSAMLEAMACGLPGIVTRVSGAQDVVVDQVNGLLIPPNNPAALAEALAALLSSPQLRSELGIAARATIEQRYGCAAAAQQLDELYSLLLRARA